MAADGEELYFAYDAAGIPMAVWYVDTNYYYVTNIQGDVIGILDNTGKQVVAYTYDAWGNVLSITGTMAATLGTLNPLRYRGYIYDNETELYYLQSRYYDPQLGRFINADAFAATGQGLIGNNMFAYCNNNPVNFHDPTGLCKNTFSIYFKVDCKSSKCKTSDYYQEPGFLKGFLQHMARTRNTGHTVSVGFTGGQNTGGTTGSKSHVLSVDSSYNYAFQETTSLGASVGAGGSVGLTISVTNASNISDLNGISYSHGITLIGCTGLSVDYVTFIPASNPNSHRWGVNVVVALGAEVEAHVSENYTTTTSNVFNPFLWLNKKIYGG